MKRAFKRNFDLFALILSVKFTVIFVFQDVISLDERIYMTNILE